MSNPTRHEMTTYWTPRTLLVSDPAVGPRAEQVLRRFFPDQVSAIWDINREPDTKARATVAGGPWDIVFSVHNDLLFSAQEISGMGLALNLHPALPIIPGIGHDVIPILEQHADVGVTLHEIVEKIDSGTIFHVERLPLPSGASRSLVRQVTQSLCLHIIEWSARIVQQASSAREAREALLTEGNGAGRQWGELRRTRSQIANIVEGLRSCDPTSPILQ
jgi:methionyl-tRNA formyltransferase